MIRLFGRADAADIHEVTLKGPGGTELKVLNWGALIRDLAVLTERGPQHVVLGFETIDDYVAHSPYFGAVVGRYANRIGGARFTLGDETFRLDRNEGENQLHGGSRGFGTRPWTFVDHQAAEATLALLSEDGDMGYPGRLLATCTYALTISHDGAPTLRIVLSAMADRMTPINLTNHAYFNLDGGPDILSHELLIEGDFVTPTRPDLIPTGAIASVAETPYDFRRIRPIAPVAQDGPGTLYDINYVLRRSSEGLTHAATLASGLNGLAMELWTTEPGLQFYDGHLIHIPVPGLNGTSYGMHAGLCLEPQRFPDGPNKAHFPGTILSPGAVSRQVSEYRFRLQGT